MKKLLSFSILTLLLTSLLAAATNIRVARASETIFIRADGSIDPPTAPIWSVDGYTYKFTGDVDASIVVQRNNILIDGGGHTIAGSGSEIGLDLSNGNNVTVQDLNVRAFYYGIYLNCSSAITIAGGNISDSVRGVSSDYSSDNAISASNVVNNDGGVFLNHSTGNTISRNNISTDNNYGLYLVDSPGNMVVGNDVTSNDVGVHLVSSNINAISDNNVVDNRVGVYLDSSSNNNVVSANSIAEGDYGLILGSAVGNMIFRNNISDNGIGIYLWSSSNNMLCHNDFAGNVQQVDSHVSVNVWDDGYPSGGNYWSGYAGSDADSDGIGDTSYIIDVDNQDGYPLMNPWVPADIAATNIRAYFEIGAVILTKTVFPTPDPSWFFCANVTVQNQGNKIEGFSLTVYANETVVGVEDNILLLSAESKTTKLLLNITGLAKGNYTMWAKATPLPEETHVADNTVGGAWFVLTLPGDVDGDFNVDILDIVQITSRYGRVVIPIPPESNYDIDGSGVINIFDVVICTSNYGRKWP